MSRFRRLFLVWCIPLLALWLCANWPRDGGSLKFYLEWAGFPWIFAFWDSGRLERFSVAALVADVVLAVGSSVTVAAVCAWFRCRRLRFHSVAENKL